MLTVMPEFIRIIGFTTKTDEFTLNTRCVLTISQKLNLIKYHTNILYTC